jgi:putative glutamine amidotransferase
MPPRIAIPLPHSLDPEYAERAMPQYERAVEMAGGEPVRISLDTTTAEVMQLVAHCDGVLLPGSKADIDPARFKSSRSPHTAAADPRRDEVDNILLDDAYRLRKPVLGICYGLQSLNVFRGGSLVQHIPDFLPEETRGRINHEAGRTVAVAHRVEIDSNSRLAGLICGDSRPRLSGRAQIGGEIAKDDSVNNRERHGFSRADAEQERSRALALEGNEIVLPVNSSHHQSAEAIGAGLQIVARCPDDGIIEALEGTSPDHFVVAVQWHPERSVDQDGASLAIFRALAEAAAKAR